MQGEYVLSQNEIVIKYSDKGEFTVRTPYVIEDLRRELRGNGCIWRPDGGFWQVPPQIVERIKETVGQAFRLPVYIETIDC